MLVVENLTKHFADLTAVNNVLFSVAEGNILGKIGQNGSRKTTIYRIIWALLTPEGKSVVHWQGEK